MTYDDCKKQVAEKHGFSQWRSVPIGAADVLTEKAIEKYAQSKANFAVKEAKERIKEYILSNPPSLILENILHAAPLPFPDEQ